ncbi:MAG: HAMP domain-containing histidine kinase [Alphaproteobacteria bacterium]|nr:HAMP domain-containing histidine kinase [Alphaproteobacteria bacterium]
MKSLAGTIAHEMRTPFLGIRASVGGIQKFLPPLIEGYHKAKDAQLDINPISEKNLHQLTETPENLTKITQSASMVIDMLLMTLKDDSFTDKNFETCFIGKCVTDMFHDYPLTSEQKALISWKDTPDFSFYGNKLLMKHVLFNLLKNALYYVKAANKGDVSLWTETTSSGNYLYFKDTGKGMPSSMVTHIFDRFYSHTQHGTGIGLAFCKSVMESFGGTILCESKEGEYTTFILKFPISMKAE